MIKYWNRKVECTHLKAVEKYNVTHKGDVDLSEQYSPWYGLEERLQDSFMGYFKHNRLIWTFS